MAVLKKTEENTQNEETPTFPSMEDIDAKINAAITGHLKRFGSSFEKKLGDMLAQHAPKAPEDQESKGGDTDEVAKRIKKLEAQIQSERQAREDAEKAREEERTARARNEEDSALSTALRDAGIQTEVADAVHALLRTKGRVARDESGEIRFKLTDKHGNERMLPLKDGLSEWTKAEGKAFLPAVPVKGTRTGQIKPPTKLPGKDPSPKEIAKADAMNVFAQMLSGGTSDDE